MRLTVCMCQVGKAAKLRLSPGQYTTRGQTVDLQKYAAFSPTSMSLQSFLDFGSQNANAMVSYQFLRQELPVRLANIMQEFNHLPPQLRRTSSVQQVQGWYMKSFEDLLEFHQTNETDDHILERFTEALDVIRHRHTTVVETMARGVIELKEESDAEGHNMEGRLQYFLDRFYMSRISIRMLINQHLLLFAPNLETHSSHIGGIDPHSHMLHIAEDAYENARFLCEQYYLNSPACEFKCLDSSGEESDSAITITYVPSHLYHILFELFKNSLRAVVEHHDEDELLPKIKVLIVQGKEDVTIKLSDQGGGIARSEIDLLFNYMYSSAPRPPSPSAASSTPLAGYGYGLPLSRLYAKYFNGDLWLSSMEGYGTDAMVYLKVFPADASELLPVYNKTSQDKYTSSIPVGDWSDSTQTTGLHGAYHTVGHPNLQNRSYTTAAGGRSRSSRCYSTAAPHAANSTQSKDSSPHCFSNRCSSNHNTLTDIVQWMGLTSL